MLSRVAAPWQTCSLRAKKKKKAKKQKKGKSKDKKKKSSKKSKKKKGEHIVRGGGACQQVGVIKGYIRAMIAKAAEDNVEFG